MEIPHTIDVPIEGNNSENQIYQINSKFISKTLQESTLFFESKIL